MIGFCSRKLGGSALQAHELLDMEKEGPAYDLFKAKIEVFFLTTKEYVLPYFEEIVRDSHGRDIRV